MAGLALLLKSRGNIVSGCDLHVSLRTEWLERQGIPVEEGHSPDHVVDCDEVVVTPAVDRVNPELLAATNVRYRGEVLAELVGDSDSIAVCGSHGKTTTSTFVAKLLRGLGEDVAWCIGGETGDFPVAGVGKGPLVVEADESDGTLALYHARILVVNKCEYDHPDHFPTEADYFACYDEAKRNAGVVIESEKLEDIPELEGVLHGLAVHNRKNARAAVEVALRRGHSIEDIAAALPQAIAELPDRRFQKIADGVYTDYAHHPTEMQCAVSMARAICRGRLRVLFQPHRYSRTRALLKGFPAAFAEADEVILCPTYAAFERPVAGGTVADLYRECRRELREKSLFLARGCDEAWEHAHNSMQDGDVTLLLGAGDIIRLVPSIEKPLPVKTRRIWIGMGTNTWKSDLNLKVEYVPTAGPAGRPGAAMLSDPMVGPMIPWMVGIPGTIGGWVRMNAGAFGHSISEAIARVKIDGRWVSASECGFGYRHSDIDGEIQDVEWRNCQPDRVGDGVSAAEYLGLRKRFPAHTWGSVFRNPPGDFAGRLLEEAGAKDLRVGGAYVWDGHANVIVAGEGTTASDVLALAQLMHAMVFHRFGVSLVPEICGIFIGN